MSQPHTNRAVDPDRSKGGLRASRHSATRPAAPVAADAFLTTRETAALLNLSERTVEARRLAGDGPPYLKIGRSVRYSREAVLAWAMRRTVSPDAGACSADPAHGAGVSASAREA